MQMFDAQQALGFVLPQTYRINAATYMVQYPSYDFAQLMSVDSTDPEWADGVISFIGDTVGKARWQSTVAKDVPKADVVRNIISKSFELASIGYGFDIAEVARAQMLGIPLTSQKAEAARRGYMQFMYSLAINGDTEKGLQGLVNYTGVSAGNVALNVAGTSRLWAAKAPNEIIADVNAVLLGVYSGSAYVEMANTLRLPISSLTYLGQTPMPNTTTTLLDFIRLNNIYTQTTGKPLTITGLRDLETAGASGTKRMVAYMNDEGVVKLHMPMPHKFLGVYQDGPLSYEVPGIFRTGGVEILRPGAFRYADGF